MAGAAAHSGAAPHRYAVGLRRAPQGTVMARRSAAASRSRPSRSRRWLPSWNRPRNATRPASRPPGGPTSRRWRPGLQFTIFSGPSTSPEQPGLQSAGNPMLSEACTIKVTITTRPGSRNCALLRPESPTSGSRSHLYAAARHTTSHMSGDVENGVQHQQHATSAVGCQSPVAAVVIAAAR